MRYRISSPKDNKCDFIPWECVLVSLSSFKILFIQDYTKFYGIGNLLQIRGF